MSQGLSNEKLCNWPVLFMESTQSIKILPKQHGRKLMMACTVHCFLCVLVATTTTHRQWFGTEAIIDRDPPTHPMLCGLFVIMFSKTINEKQSQASQSTIEKTSNQTRATFSEHIRPIDQWRASKTMFGMIGLNSTFVTRQFHARSCVFCTQPI